MSDTDKRVYVIEVGIPKATTLTETREAGEELLKVFEDRGWQPINLLNAGGGGQLYDRFKSVMYGADHDVLDGGGVSDG